MISLSHPKFLDVTFYKWHSSKHLFQYGKMIIYE